MRYRLLIFKLLIILLAYVVITRITTGQTMPKGYNNAGKTIVWVISKAEKDRYKSTPQKEVLSDRGKQNVNSLAQYLKFINIDACYTTSSTLSMKTIEPMVRQNKFKKTENYAEQDIATLIKDINTNHKGETSLVVLNQSQVLDFIITYGGAKPVSRLGSEDQDFIFKLSTLPNSDEVFVEMDRYYAGHHDREE